MCLYAKNNVTKPSVAEKDIKCYKFFLELEDGSLETPYMLKRVFDRSMHEDKFQMNPGRIDYEIEVGIHSYNDRRVTCLHAEALYLGLHQHFVVKECVIPKGTYFWEGIYNDYCSKDLIIKDTVDTFPQII